MSKDKKIKLEKKLVEISTPQDFIKFVAEYHGFTLEAICGPARNRELVDVRTKIVRALKDKWGMTDKSIGRLINRERTSVINLYQREGGRLWRMPSNPLEGVLTTERVKKTP